MSGIVVGNNCSWRPFYGIFSPLGDGVTEMGQEWREISALTVSTVLPALGGAKFLSLPPTPAIDP